MQNQLLSITRNVIPYVKELRKLDRINSASTAILTQQLDYWFHHQGDGFYKFLAPCEHEDYREGDSWTEELGFSKKEFNTAFDAIGTRWKSTKSFRAADDIFEGQYYASVYDRVRHKTYYYRNHELMDSHLDWLLNESKKDETSNHAGISPNPLKEISRSDQKELPEVNNGNFDLYTDITPEITQERESLSQNKKNQSDDNLMQTSEESVCAAAPFSFSEEKHINHTPEHLKQAHGENHIATMEARFRRGIEPPNWSSGDRVDGRYKVKPEFERWLKDKGYFKDETTAVFIRNTLNKQLDSYCEEYKKFEKEQQKKTQTQEKTTIEELPENFWRWFHIPYLLGCRLYVNTFKGQFRLAANQLPPQLRQLGFEPQKLLDDLLEKYPTMEDLVAEFERWGQLDWLKREVLPGNQTEEKLEATKAYVDIKQRVMTGDLC